MLVLWKILFHPSQVELQALDIPPQVKTFDQLAAHLPGGAYTTLRTYQARYTLRLEDHIRRLEESAALVDIPVRLDEGLLREALRLALGQVASHAHTLASPGGAHATRPSAPSAETQPFTEEVRIRLTLDLQQQPGALYIAVEPLETPPARAYQEGVRVITCDLQRPLPQAKLTGFIARAEHLRQALPEDVNEAIMVDPEGRLLEGLSSNFFALSGGALFTAGEAVLAGVTRGLVLEAAAQVGIPVHLEPIHVEDIPTLQGACLTSSSRGLLPVRQIDAFVLGEGRPAPGILQMRDAFEACVLEKLEPL
jgi:branched-chain amino acid aminotransferase